MSPRRRLRRDATMAGGQAELDLAPPLEPPWPRPVAAGVLRIVARTALWTLVALGALRGLAAGPGPPAATTPSTADGRAPAVAAAFLREYLTAGDGMAGWRARLRPFMAPGVEPGEAPRRRSGTSRYADLVVPAGTRPAEGGVEVTVLAHVVEVRAGRYRDGEVLAYVVDVTATAAGVAVSGPPRRAPLPFGRARGEGARPAGHSSPAVAGAASSEPAPREGVCAAGRAGPALAASGPGPAWAGVVARPVGGVRPGAG